MAPVSLAAGAGRRRPWQPVWQRAESCNNNYLAGFAQAPGRR
jgi:hypothetical protein